MTLKIICNKIIHLLDFFFDLVVGDDDVITTGAPLALVTMVSPANFSLPINSLFSLLLTLDGIDCWEVWRGGCVDACVDGCGCWGGVSGAFSFLFIFFDVDFDPQQHVEQDIIAAAPW